MHYTNPEGAADIIDSSGLSLGVTTKLRPHEAGIMTLGPVFDVLQIRVPARRVGGWVRATEREGARELGTCAGIVRVSCSYSAFAQQSSVLIALDHLEVSQKADGAEKTMALCCVGCK